MENLGEIIRQHRKKLGLTTQELANIISLKNRHLDRSYISKIERYNYPPSAEVYLLIELALKIPQSYRHLYFKTKEKPRKDYWKRSKQLDKIEKDLKRLQRLLERINSSDTASLYKDLIKRHDALISQHKKSYNTFLKESNKLTSS